jgi:hypothetical protein
MGRNVLPQHTHRLLWFPGEGRVERSLRFQAKPEVV